MAELPDAELVEAARRGDLDSLGALYRRHYASLVGVAYCILGDHQSAEDAAQEAFVVGCRDLHRLKQSSSFPAWMGGICRNLALKALRNRADALPTDDLASPVPDDAEDQRQAVWQAVQGLPENAREVVLLHYFSGLGHERIALMLEISPSAVHGRLVRARRELAKRLRKLGLEKR